MTYRWLLKPQILVVIPLALLLVLAVACGGGEEEPDTPASTSSTSEETEPTATPTREVVLFPATAPPESDDTSAQAGAPTATPTAAPQSTPTQPSADETKFGGIIPMQQYQATNLRAVHAWGLPTTMTLSPMFSNMVEYDPEEPDPAAIRCDLCESWEVSDDSLTYTFRLNEEAKFWDGHPVTAEDWLFSLHSMLDKNTILDKDGNAIFQDQTRSSTVAGMKRYLLPWPDCCRAVDEYTVEMELQFPTSTFIASLAIDTAKVMARHTVLDEGKIQTMAAPEDMNGSGPFMHEKYVKDVSNHFVRNDVYWKAGYPRIDGMIHYVLIDSGTVIAAFKTEQVLMTNSSVNNLSNAEAIQLEKEVPDRLTIHWTGPVGVIGVVLNTSRKPFDDRRVRQAFNLAMHRQPLITIFSEGMDSFGSPLPPDTWFSRSSEEVAQLPGFRELDGKKHPDDIAEAKRLLSEAGVPEGTKLTLTTRNVLEYPEVAEVLADQLRRFLGLNITLNVVEGAAGFDAYDRGEFVFMVQGSSLAGLNPDDVLSRQAPATIMRWAGGGVEGGDFTVDGFMELYDQQMRESDVEKRNVLNRQIEDLLVNVDNAYPLLYWSMRSWIVDNRIHDFNAHPGVHAYLKWENLWCDPAC